MARTPSTMLDLGTPAADFTLPSAVTGKQVSLTDFSGQPLLLIFMCNHCPFVVHVLDELALLCREYGEKGIRSVAINSNDVESYPDDSPEKMKELVETLALPFDYLYDEDQSVALAYNAACTPDFYLFDADMKLVYRGQLDGARPGNDVPVNGADIRAAADALLSGKAVSPAQKPSLGCNIKWKDGNSPDYFRH